MCDTGNRQNIPGLLYAAPDAAPGKAKKEKQDHIYAETWSDKQELVGIDIIEMVGKLELEKNDSHTRANYLY